MKNRKTERGGSIQEDGKGAKEVKLEVANNEIENRKRTQVCKNEKKYDGIALHSKNIEITRKEIEHRFYSEKKEHDIVYSTPKHLIILK